MPPAGAAHPLARRRQDEIALRLSPGKHGTTDLELQHATTIDEHEIGGQMYDAIFCMGGGYYPRFVALDRHLRGELPEDYDSLKFHQIPEMRPIIDRGSAAMTALLEEDAATPAGEPITIERTYAASADEVWALWTTAEGIEAWWAPDGFTAEVTAVDPKPGGSSTRSPRPRRPRSSSCGTPACR